MNSRLRLPRDEHILQLMADRATQGLSCQDALELDTFFARNPDVERDGLDYAAAAVCLAFGAGQGEPLPAHVRDKVLSEAAR